MAELQQLLKNTDHNGFPVVVSRYCSMVFSKLLTVAVQRISVSGRIRAEARPVARFRERARAARVSAGQLLVRVHAARARGGQRAAAAQAEEDRGSGAYHHH